MRATPLHNRICREPSPSFGLACDRAKNTTFTLSGSRLVLEFFCHRIKAAYEPVIQTTVRPPKSTLRISLESGEIQATGGHLWWVSGRGWVRTRDLKEGMQLHNATGISEVRKLVEDPLECETYNLVVDGFHTYFVGQDRVLSYDNTIVKPTLRTVPGYGLLASVVPAKM